LNVEAAGINGDILLTMFIAACVFSVMRKIILNPKNLDSDKYSRFYIFKMVVYIGSITLMCVVGIPTAIGLYKIMKIILPIIIVIVIALFFLKAASGGTGSARKSNGGFGSYVSRRPSPDMNYHRDLAYQRRQEAAESNRRYDLDNHGF
jgi:hypothetical protein